MMKKYLLLLFILATPVHAEGWLQDMTQPDKVSHYAWGATMTAVGSIFTTPEIGFGVTVLAAVGKEYYDKQHPETHRAETNDALATILGGAVVYAAIKTEKLKLAYSHGTPIFTYVMVMK